MGHGFGSSEEESLQLVSLLWFIIVPVSFKPSIKILSEGFIFIIIIFFLFYSFYILNNCKENY